MKKLLLLLFIICSLFSNAQTANDFSSYKPYLGKYSFSSNTDYFGNQFSNTNLSQMLWNAGGKRMRIFMPDYIITPGGSGAFTIDVNGYTAVGMTRNIAFADGCYSGNSIDTTFPGCSQASHLWRGMYKPIFNLDGSIDTANTFANYFYKLVTTYPQVDTWEGINEPDLTGDCSYNVGSPCYWGTHFPQAADLYNLQSPVYYYVRLLRIMWTVGRRVNPNCHITYGGLGSYLFLKQMLTVTDNPVDGSVTVDYPLKAGAYYDISCFHYYPQFSYFSVINSDVCLDMLNQQWKSIDSVSKAAGYDGITYPYKKGLFDETDVPKTSTNPGNWYGDPIFAKNYLMKAQIIGDTSLLEGIKYGLGDKSSNNTFDKMGLYGNLSPSNTTVANAPKSEEFWANATMSTALYGKNYDRTFTIALSLPSNIRGAVFKDSVGNKVLCLWAKVTANKSETASASYTLSGTCTRWEWDYSSTGVQTTVSGTVPLTGSPSFFLFVPLAPAPNKAPIANAGTDQNITLPTNSVTLSGSGTDNDGTISSYSWVKINGGIATITTLNAAIITITGLVQGTYNFSLTVTDNLGATGKDTVQVIVKPVIPIANAGADTTINVGGTVTLKGSCNVSCTYSWTDSSGRIIGTTTNISVAGLKVGTYTYKLTVKDSTGLTNSDTVVVTVVDPNPIIRYFKGDVRKDGTIELQ